MQLPCLPLRNDGISEFCIWLNSENTFHKILVTHLQITKVKKICLSNTNLKPHNAQSLSLLLFSMNILSMPTSLEQVVPGGERKFITRRLNGFWFSSDNNCPFIKEMLPLEGKQRAPGEARPCHGVHQAVLNQGADCWSSAKLPVLKRLKKNWKTIKLQAHLLWGNGKFSI